MPQTFTQLHYHIIFSTKHRVPLIHTYIQDRLWGYHGGIVSGEGGHPIEIGRIEDHVYLLVTFHQLNPLPRWFAGSNLIRRIGSMRIFRRFHSDGQQDTPRLPSVIRRYQT